MNTPPNINRESQPSLKDLLNAEYHALCRFVVIAEAEQAALIASDADALETIAAEKQSVLADVARCRSATKRAIGEPIGAGALSEMLLAAGQGARDVFELVLAKAREASELTQLSSKLVAHQTKRLNGLATALASTGVRSHGYGPTGFTSHHGEGSSYGTA